MKKDKKKKKIKSAAIPKGVGKIKSAASSLRSNLKTTVSAAKEFKSATKSAAKPNAVSKVKSAASKKPFVGAKSAATPRSEDIKFKKALKKKKKK